MGMPPPGSTYAGSGDSDGILEDEYLPLEQSDGVEVVRWLASQPWCSGRVGIIGKSWGGFNALQIAAHAPDELGAIISVASTDDRYSDDVHYMGGCVLAWTALNWASTMLAYNARPPDPAVVGDDWRDIWFERMERTPPFIEAWMSHQRRDEFWQQGSVCEDYSAITCPVYMVGGWSDAYRNSILRFLRALRRALQGAHRAVGARLPSRRSARACHRLPAGVRAVVGSLAEGPGHRHHVASRSSASGWERRAGLLPATPSGRAAGWPSTAGRRRRRSQCTRLASRTVGVPTGHLP